MIDLCTPHQAAASLAASQNQLLALVNAGELPAFNIGGAIRFRRSDVHQLAGSQSARS